MGAMIQHPLLRRASMRGGGQPVLPAPAGERWDLSSEDGVPLVARVFRAARTRRVLVIYSGTACPKWLYARFGQWLAQRGWSVVTFDYRGLGESGSAATLGAGTGGEQWALDGSAVVAAAARAFPGLPLVVLGHSFGGLLSCTLDHPAVTGILTVGTTQGYWRDWSGMHLPLLVLMWKFGFPLVARWYGHVPAGWFGLPEGVPAGIVRQWETLLASPDLVEYSRRQGALAQRLGERFALQQRPIVAYAIGDDPVATPAGVKRAHSYLTGTAVQLRVHQPIGRMGHFGVFARRGQYFWPELEVALRSLAAPHESEPQLQQPATA